MEVTFAISQSFTFSSPELKALVCFSDRLWYNVRPSVCMFVNFTHFHVRTTGSILTKLVTMHPWTKGIQVCSNEDPRPFPRGDNCENTLNYKIFSRTTDRISTRLGEGNSFFYTLSKEKILLFSLYQFNHWYLQICFLIGTVSRVGDVTLGLLFAEIFLGSINDLFVLSATF